MAYADWMAVFPAIQIVPPCAAGTQVDVFFDGGWSSKTSTMETFVMVAGVPHHRSWRTRRGSSNRAELRAARAALALAHAQGVSDIRLVGDSKLVVDAIAGTRTLKDKVLARLLKSCARAGSKARAIAPVHVRRALNPAGVELGKLQRRRRDKARRQAASARRAI